MRIAMAVSLVAVVLATTACESERYIPDNTGKLVSKPCVGIVDDRDSTLTYKVSIQNVVVGALGASFLFIPPAIVLADELYCPTAFRQSRVGHAPPPIQGVP